MVKIDWMLWELKWLFKYKLEGCRVRMLKFLGRGNFWIVGWILGLVNNREEDLSVIRVYLGSYK